MRVGWLATSLLTLAAVLASACGDPAAAEGGKDAAPADALGGTDATAALPDGAVPDADGPADGLAGDGQAGETLEGDTAASDISVSDTAVSDTAAGDAADPDTAASDVSVSDVSVSDTAVSDPDGGDVPGSDGAAVDGSGADTGPKACAAATDCNDGNACTKDTCKDGTCAYTKQPDNIACNDGEACTKNDHCEAGACVGGVIVCACLDDADCAAKEDGNPCNGTLYCDKPASDPLAAACKIDPKTVVTCDASQDTACLKNTCDKATGQCDYAPVTGKGFVPCDDGDPCTVNDECQGGVCKTGLYVCQCKQDVDCAPMQNDNICDGTLICDKSKAPYLCTPDPKTVPPPCPTAGDTACVKNQCQPKTGLCAPTNVTTPCNDGDACTSGDFCSGGVCKYIKNDCLCAKADCDDANPCTSDSCFGDGKCAHPVVPTGTPCGDGLVCKTGKCGPK